MILTKVDKLSQSEFSNAEKIFQKTFPELSLNSNLFFYSSVKGGWKAAMQKKILDLFYR
jgi:GTP-binding protein EngB required for normal cell division